jgi:hypothetical protein
MNYMVFALGLGALAGSSFGAAVPLNNVNTEASFASLEASLGVSLTPVDLSAQPIPATTGLNAQNNVLVSTFGVAPFYTGTLTSEVFANQSSTGPGITDVVIKYTFVGNGPQGIDTFNFGLDDGTVLDYGDLQAATHGRINAESTPGQLTPGVTIDNSGNTTLDFTFIGGGDTLGAPSTTESFTWYIAASGDIKVNLVDVTITDFDATTAKALSITTTSGQQDLDFPAPGAAMGLAGLGILGLRRRR